jgi:hypothetical protein
MAIPNDPDTLLRRRPCAAALTEAGYPTSPATLATKATRGGGPPFRCYGRLPLYRWADALEWAKSRLGPVITTTAQRDIGRRRDRAPATRLAPVASEARAE